MLDSLIAEMSGVREYEEGFPVELVWREDVGRPAIIARNQDGYDSVSIDLFDLLNWLRSGQGNQIPNVPTNRNHVLSRQSGANNQLTDVVSVLAAELLRQDPDAVDLSDDSLTRLQLFDTIDVVELAGVVRAHRNRSVEITPAMIEAGADLIGEWDSEFYEGPYLTPSSLAGEIFARMMRNSPT